MKFRWLILGSVALMVSNAWGVEKVTLKTDKEKLSYSIGASVGKNLKIEGTDVDLNVLIEGFKSSLGGADPLMTDLEVRKVMNDFQLQMRQRSAAKRQSAMTDNKRAGDAYIANYSTQKGVASLPGGILYKVIKNGDGNKPNESEDVIVNYQGKHINGKEFDATEPGKPATLKVASLIPGWKRTLAAMPVGSKWEIVLPSELAYGERGAGGDIGPNEVLVFDLELIAIKQ
jgi:FKBP-type peptidyl-prolyl cis-trans isomerase FklB